MKASPRGLPILILALSVGAVSFAPSALAATTLSAAGGNSLTGVNQQTAYLPPASSTEPASTTLIFSSNEPAASVGSGLGAWWWAIALGALVLVGLGWWAWGTRTDY